MSRRRNLEAELLELIGEQALFDLTEAYGGLDTIIPHEAHGSNLAQAIGNEAAAMMSRAYTGEQMSIPIARDFRMREWLRRGQSKKWVAKHLGVSESAVYRTIKRVEKRGLRRDQLDLFAADEDAA